MDLFLKHKKYDFDPLYEVLRNKIRYNIIFEYFDFFFFFLQGRFY